MSHVNNTARRHPFAALLPALRPERRGMFISYVVGTVSALALAAIAVLTSWAVGHAVVERELPSVAWWATMTGLVLARTVLTWQEMDVSHALAYRVLARLRMALFDSYSRSVPARTREHSGRAATVAMDDIEKLEFFYAHTVAQIATSFTVLAASLVTASVLLPQAAAVVCGGAVLIGASVFLGGRSMRALGAQEQHERSDLSTRIVDVLGTLREVLAYGLTTRVVDDVLESTGRATALTRRREMLAQCIAAVREFTVTAVVIGVIVTSAHALGLFGEGNVTQFSPAVLPALIALALVGVSAVTDATTTLTQLHPLVASAQRVSDGIHRPALITVPQEPRALPDGPLGVRFREVSFTYDDRTPVLSSWSAEVHAGEHVGLAGPSGAGKSTLVALTARLWEPHSGSIDVVAADGSHVGLHEVDEASLRAAVAVVDQESTLFHGTVRENLVRGAAAAISDADLMAALERVDAASWIDLDTHVGQGGLRLSGGQQARLCLARALVKKPRILLVDEVTASLDPESEQVISEAIAAYEGTVLISSHRTETLNRRERIIRLSAH
ncbi:ABC transporter ATP-binding protein [Timonella sp. A28]|uniref:ABC transporter ATP-binding protein n=1 Tax=Timonella sp. A28 TaxID=3442640 RepID=UPI003EC04C26